MMYITLRKSYLERTMEEANKRAIKEYGEEDGVDRLLWDIDRESIKLKIEEGGVIHLLSDSQLAFITLSYKLNVDEQIKIVEQVVKRLHKIKSMLDALK